MNQTKLLKPITVTTALKKAGFRKSEYLRSNIRGWGNSTEGFEVEAEYTSEWKSFPQSHYTKALGWHTRRASKEVKTYTGRIFVEYQQSTSISATYSPENQEQKLNAMEATLKEAGFTVGREIVMGFSESVRLVVTR